MKRWERAGTDEVDPVIPMTLEEYLNSRFRPDMDYYDGAARERNRALWPHSETMGHVSARLEEKAERHGLLTLMSCRTRVSSDAVLVPDLCLIRKDAPYEGVLVTPPMLCVEILDEANTFHTMLRRVAMLRAMGVGSVWLIDERGEFGFSDSSIGFVRPNDDVLRLAGTDIEFALAEIVSEMDDR